MTRAPMRPAWVEIDVDAVRHNAAFLKRVAGTAELCAVVKADGYGHGAVDVAKAAVEGGATWLAVAVVEEGLELREAGIRVPVVVLSEQRREAMEEAIRNGIELAVYTENGIDDAEAAAEALGTQAGSPAVADVHLKVDTGMHRVGADPQDAVALARRIDSSGRLRLASVWTHLAVADGTSESDEEFTRSQIGLYEAVLGAVDAEGIRVPMRHASNSAGALAYPEARYDMVRCGIALYGELPARELAPVVAELGDLGEELRPVLSLRSRVSQVRRLSAGERPSYGRRRPLPADADVAVVPIGYADGVPRAYFERGGSVLVGGRRCVLAGTVTMDMIVVDCGNGSGVAVGDDVVLIGSAGEATISAADWADTLGTISYEVLCSIGPRVPRVVVDRTPAR